MPGFTNVSLEDWVVSNFGRTMFNLYFKECSEKVWGIESRRISKEWVAARIRGLSLIEVAENILERSGLKKEMESQLIGA
ncbi:MAG: hypothetical protein BMS9Abin21_341 [Thermodesulfovibrionia bacterium]|nr:MAG: hypothetical protein BMS9Abin21_341 [Thermodesulfovibrionia bacterium]